jgi:hypothetical protein
VITKNKQPRDVIDPLYRPLTSARGESKKTQITKTLSSADAATQSSSSSLADCRHMVGENQNIEKPYLRLTTFPKTEDIRPLDVLIKSLAHIKARYIQLEDFDWANEQVSKNHPCRISR